MHHFFVPTFFLITHQRNPLTNQFFNQLLAQARGEGICRENGSIRSIIRNLRSGKVLRVKGLHRAAQFSWQRTARDTIACYKRLHALR